MKLGRATAATLLTAILLAGCYQRTERLPRVVEIDGRPVLRLCVVPDRTPRAAITHYGPLADRLALATGRRVLVAPAATWAIARERLAREEADIAILGAVAHARARHEGAVLGLAHELIFEQPTYRAAIVVRAGSSIRTIADLAGRRLALVDPESTTGQLLPLTGLREAGLAPSVIAEIRYADRQEEVIRAVLMGKVDGGAVREATARRHASSSLRTIWTSESLPGPVLVVRTELAAELRAGVVGAVLGPDRDMPVAGHPGAEPIRFVTLADDALTRVEGLMVRIYGEDALVRNLRLPEATPR